MTESSTILADRPEAASFVEVRREGDVVVLELCREERRNALNTQMCDDIRVAAEAAVAEGARALLLTGRGDVFCAGADLSGDVYSGRFPLALVWMLDVLQTLPVPVLAAVNGPAIGAGVQLALACDLRVVAEDARFEVPVAKNGLTVHNWTIRRLSDVVGGGPARTMLLGARAMFAPEALERGLANVLGELPAALAWAHELAALAPLSLRHLKMVFNDDGARDQATPAQADAFQAAWNSADKNEARQARKEGRAPEFQGR
ncbi:enoyl-CoA hydratase [Tomitella biformata]|uniref:enoyl-CoA hydratase n=1 Tax=Tomitella biformata TaxID=630403 RepID=UPI0004AD053B|nr:enoyl-CoA hydratase [Tomitella biformata]